VTGGTGTARPRSRAAGGPAARSGRFRRNPRRRARWARLARPVIGVAAALALWEALTESGALDPRDVPTVQSVAAAFGGSFGTIGSSLGATLESLFIGLVIASVAGTVAGIAVGLSAWAEAATDVIVRMMRPLPSLALIPIAILVAGLGTEMTSGLVAFAAFWPVFINARYGTRQVESRLLETGRALGFSRWELIWRIVVPSAAPAVATGIRIAVGMATVVTVSVELVAGTGGLGGYVVSAQQGGSVPQMYAGIIVGGIIGWLLNLAVGAIAGRALAWDAAAASRGVTA
jgi:ABC-type nitrate/sulfonate/bicarbonate transport system permease component